MNESARESFRESSRGSFREWFIKTILVRFNKRREMMRNDEGIVEGIVEESSKNVAMATGQQTTVQRLERIRHQQSINNPLESSTE